MMTATYFMHAYFKERRPGKAVEFFRYLPVSLITSLIDIGLLILLTEAFGVHYLVSATIGFILGQIWAYTASVRWVFAKRRHENHAIGFSAFVALSVIGLVLTISLLWFATEGLGLYYIYSRLVCGAVVALLIYLARKRLLFS